MPKPMIGAGGKPLIGPGGKPMTGEPECECCPECDCETEGPTADFSYEQTDNEPCLVNLFDESVAGECGDIVSYVWKLNGVQFSTDQNPEGVEFEDGDEITLEIEDEFGCTDSVVMEIACADDSCEGDSCPQTLCTAATVPGEVTVIIAGYTGPCAVLINGTYVLPVLSEVNCTYEDTFVKEGSNVTVTFRISATGGGGAFETCGRHELEIDIPGAPAIHLEWNKNAIPIDNAVVDGDCSTFVEAMDDGDASVTDSDCFVLGSPPTGYTIDIAATG